MPSSPWIPTAGAPPPRAAPAVLYSSPSERHSVKVPCLRDLPLGLTITSIRLAAQLTEPLGFPISPQRR
ncbi:hypothetical protein E2562_009676, partial [Oryza meyeriana var. granulata]